jgi:hypothetical protein
MTSSSNVRRFMAAAATALVLPFALAANANAESISRNAESISRNVELTQLDLSKPLPSNICFVDNNKGTAISKLMTALGARQQKSVIVSDKVGAMGSVAAIYTSNLVRVRQDVPNLFGEGYSIGSDHPASVVSSGYCLNRLDRTYVVNNESVKSILGIFGRGEMGQALSNAAQKGDKFAFGGLTDLGTLVAVSFDSSTKRGGVLASDGSGNSTVGFPIENAGYSQNLTADARQVIGLPPLAQTAPPSVATLARR